MVTDFSKEIASRLEALEKIGITFEVENSRRELEKLRQEASAPDLWNDQKRASETMALLSYLEELVSTYDSFLQRVSELEDMNALSLEENDPSFEEEIVHALDELDKRIDSIESRALLGGELDAKNAIVSIHPGAGGLESQDWAGMLLRMYIRWCERVGFAFDLNDVQPGEGEGIKSATFTVKGKNAFGLLSCEKGVHRLVRISPFDFSNRRHTSFASVDVIPEIDEELQIDIDPKDLRIDTYHSSGAGGQHVNVTDSAVRITHIPTGIVVQCQNERSQANNKAVAMKILKSRLFDLEARKREEEIQTARGPRKDIAWGNQIRSYVFYPYQLVKDHRTGVEVGDVQSVMDGEIDKFIEEGLRWKKKQAQD
ncbi:MAG: peptide chain release factor 2 [Actinomycetota bacterium]|nr:peptide chain release factor 2 [Actinomycetota bacterium]